MEEILASIRKIISDDMGAAAESKPTGEVIELHGAVEYPGASAASAPAEWDSEPAAAPCGPEDAANPLSYEETTVNSPAQVTERDEILSDKARQAIEDAFANLEGPADRPESESQKSEPTHPIGNGYSLEALFERAVRESLEPVIQKWMNSHRDDLLASAKPAIREWMDDHFPALLEGAVREEVARVVKARGGR